jgi:hypothetical protein
LIKSKKTKAKLETKARPPSPKGEGTRVRKI